MSFPPTAAAGCLLEVLDTMKLLPLILPAALAIAVACGGSNGANTSAGTGATASATPSSIAATPVSTTRVGTPRPGATPRVTASPAAAAVGIPTVPPNTAAIATTASSLQYQDIVVGTGAQPQSGQTVTVNYTGWLDNGTKFDSSLDRNQPFSFTLGQGGVIKGWDEGVATMKVGGKRRLIIPPALGYGSQSQGTIPPNSRLTFDVELLSIK